MVYLVPQKLPPMYAVIAYICMGRLRDLQYIFSVTYETHCISVSHSLLVTAVEGRMPLAGFYLKLYYICRT